MRLGFGIDGRGLIEDDFSGLTLYDLIVMLEAHVDLFVRRARERTTSLKTKSITLLSDTKGKAGMIVNTSVSKLRPAIPSSERLVGTVSDQKIAALKARAIERVANLQVVWEQEKTVKFRSKVSFFLGVMNVMASSLILGFRPSWMAGYYTLLVAALIPYRFYTYKQKLYHYFLFDLCYFVNALTLIHVWVFPRSEVLFQACFALAMGSLGTAILTWRNSLVFHSVDKVTSLTIHIMPPLVLTTIRHFIPGPHSTMSGAGTPMPAGRGLCTAMAVYLAWQTLYYRFVIVARQEKIRQGRTTSFTYLMADSKSVIGRIGARVPGPYREFAFMAGQAMYTLVTLLPPVFFLYDSRRGSGAYLVFLFAASVWNGACFYMDVYLRRFERELAALRAQLELKESPAETPTTTKATSPTETAAVTLETTVEAVAAEESNKDK